jgi:hypothetical protein
MLGHHFTIMGDDIQLACSPYRDRWWKERWTSPASAIAFYAAEIQVEFQSTNWLGLHFMESTFCGMKFILIQSPIRWISFQINTDRLWCAIQQGGDSNNPPRQLQRLGAMYNVSWADVAMRDKVDKLWFHYILSIEKGYHLDGRFIPPHPCRNTDDWESSKLSRCSEIELINRFCGNDLTSPGGNNEEEFLVEAN